MAPESYGEDLGVPGYDRDFEAIVRASGRPVRKIDLKQPVSSPFHRHRRHPDLCRTFQVFPQDHVIEGPETHRKGARSSPHPRTASQAVPVCAAQGG